MVLDLDVLIPVQVEEVKCLGVLFKSKGRVGHEIDRWIGMASTVMQMLNRSVVVKRELSIEAKLSGNVVADTSGRDEFPLKSGGARSFKRDLE